MSEVVWLAYQALSDVDKESFWGRVLSDPDLREDLLDSIVAITRDGEPTRPWNEFEKELRDEGLL
jgi:hypothetical protein